MSDGARALARVDRAETTSPFQHRAVPEAGFFDRLFRRARPDLATIAIENLLAGATPDAISWTAIVECGQRYHLSERVHREVARKLFGKAYQAVVADDVITDSEVAYLFSLRRLLDIGEDDVIALEQQTIVPRYERAVQRAIADGVVTAEERSALERLGDALRLSPAIRDHIYRRPVEELLHSALVERVADRRLSPDEFRTFAALASNLGVNPTLDEATERTMHRYALFWRIEHGDVPRIDAPIQLQRGEVCHFQAPAQWLEHRKQTSTIGYYSQGVSIRVVRGVYYRVGASRPHRVTTEGLVPIEQGMLYITNKRVILDGQTRNFALRLSSLIAFQSYSDGVVLEKASGKNPHLIVNGDAELAAVLLGALMRGATAS